MIAVTEKGGITVWNDDIYEAGIAYDTVGSNLNLKNYSTKKK